MSAVEHIGDHRPHVVICTADEKTHVFPKLLIEKWATGKAEISTTDPDCGTVLRAIIAEWLDITGRAW